MTRPPITFGVVGMRAGNRMEELQDAYVGCPAIAKPEPTNKFDPNAIKVGIRNPDGKWVQIGYIPAKLACQFSLPPEGVEGVVTDIRYAPPEADEPADTIAGCDIAVDVIDYRREQ